MFQSLPNLKLRGVAVLLSVIFAAVLLALPVEQANAQEMETPLHKAVQNRNLSDVRRLLDGGADINAQDSEGGTPLYWAAAGPYPNRRQNLVQIAELLISRGAAIDMPNNDGTTPLLLATDFRFREMVELLIRRGANVNLGNNEGTTPLHDAAGASDTDIMSLLLAGGANIEAKNSLNATPLFYSVDRSDDAIRGVNLLLKHGANPNARANSPILSGFTPLHIIAAVNSVQSCSLGPNDEPTCREIILSAAEIANSRQVAVALVRYGANVNARDSAGKTPLDYATEFGPSEYAAFFATLMNASLSGESGVLAQIRAEIDALQMEVAALRALISSSCASPPCQGTSAQQEQLHGLENQIARKTNQVDTLERTASSGGGGGGGGGGSGLAIGIGAAALLGIAIYALSPSGDAESFSLQPLASYEYRNGTESFHYGMRLSYREDSWGLWWSADDSRLGWGGEWRGEWLRAHADVWESESGADLSAGLGMEWALGGWILRPSLGLQTESGSADKWTLESVADLTAEWAQAGWTIRPSIRAADFHRGVRLQVGREF